MAKFETGTKYLSWFKVWKLEIHSCPWVTYDYMGPTAGLDFIWYAKVFEANGTKVLFGQNFLEMQRRHPLFPDQLETARR